MTCDVMRERILEADLAELSGETETPLTRHLPGCAACRILAEKIIDAEAALGTALDSMTSGVVSKSRPPRRRLWGLVPLAVAASLVAILMRGGLRPSPVPDRITVQVDHAVPLIETTGNQNVAVFSTDDPNVVVVWFLGGTD